MGEMTVWKRRLLVAAITGSFLYIQHRRKMDEFPDIPEFMRRKSHLCSEDGCVNRALPRMEKCMECAVEEIMPRVWDDVEAITKGQKKAS